MASKVIRISPILISLLKVRLLRALDLTTSHDLAVASQRISPSSKINSTETHELMRDGIQEINEQQSKAPAGSNSPQARTVKPRMRTIPPFVVAHDVPRGILYAVQMLVSYLLMLAIMSVFKLAFEV
jgi:copper transporter 1